MKRLRRFWFCLRHAVLAALTAYNVAAWFYDAAQRQRANYLAALAEEMQIVAGEALLRQAGFDEQTTA